MGYIHCCGAVHKCKVFELKAQRGYEQCRVYYLESCPICNHTVLQLVRTNKENKISIYKLKNKKAKKFFEKIKRDIISDLSDYKNSFVSHGKFYLYYNEYGKKKKCFSNLSNLKIGILEDL